MSDFLFGWISKPKLMVTFLDEVVMFGELIFVIVVCAYFAGRKK